MKKLNTILASFIAVSLFGAAAYAGDNTIYINQSGNNTNVTITQDGASNTVQGISDLLQNAAIIRGNNNIVNINQIGTGDILNFGIQTTTGTKLTGNIFSYSVTGNNANATINSNNDGLGISSNNIISVNQTGDSAYTNINTLGSGNSFNAVTAGGNANMVSAFINGTNNADTVSMVGGASNSFSLSQGNVTSQTMNGTVNVSTNGATNNITISQFGGAVGDSISIGGYNSVGVTTVGEFNGSGNTMVIAQSGVYDSALTLGGNGSGNVFNITQSALGGNNLANLQSNGSNNTFNITQTHR
jgi:hypothetical protein